MTRDDLARNWIEKALSRQTLRFGWQRPGSYTQQLIARVHEARWSFWQVQARTLLISHGLATGWFADLWSTFCGNPRSKQELSLVYHCGTLITQALHEWWTWEVDDVNSLARPKELVGVRLPETCDTCPKHIVYRVTVLPWHLRTWRLVVRHPK